MSVIFKSHKDEVFEALDEQLQIAMEECGMDAEYYSKRLCPVDTGRLRNSITHEVSGHGSDVQMVLGTNVEYSAFVENGTSRQKEKPYIKPAIADHKKHYQDVIERHLEG